MSADWEKWIRSFRQNIEEHVASALRNMEVPRQKDLRVLYQRIDTLKNKEVATLGKKVDEIRKSVAQIESLRPYLIAIEKALGAKPTRVKRKKKRKAKKKTKKKTQKKTQRRARRSRSSR